jgi:hypothetical protein
MLIEAQAQKVNAVVRGDVLGELACAARYFTLNGVRARRTRAMTTQSAPMLRTTRRNGDDGAAA